MRTINSARGAAFKDIAPGAVFRFDCDGRTVTALKVFAETAPKGAAVVIGPDGPDFPAGKVLDPEHVGFDQVVELQDAAIMPSKDDVRSGRGVFASPLEIELIGDKLFLVIESLGRQQLRVDLNSGDVGSSPGMRPAEIYTAWTLIREADGERKVIYDHRPMATGAGRLATHTADYDPFERGRE